MFLDDYKNVCGASVVFVFIVSSSGLLQCEKRVNYLERIEFCKNPDKVKILDFRNKPISKIFEDVFLKYTSVTDLCLSNTTLSGISCNIFRGMDSLENLYLNDNYLESLNNSSFGKMPKLMQLHLNNNIISNIDEGTFNELPKLTIIYIRNNTLFNVDKNIFSIDNVIYRIDFASNFLTDITFIRNLIHVKILDLPYNKIETLESNNFVNLTDLQYLDLKYNLIKELPINLFVRQTNLVQVDLSHNQLIQIETGTFAVGFRDLLLNDNKISTIGVLNNISEINLNGNLLKELSALPKNQVTLSIDDNPWNCEFIYMLTDYSNIYLSFTTTNGEKNIQGVQCEDKNKLWVSEDTVYVRTVGEMTNKSFSNPWAITIITVLSSTLIVLLMFTIYACFKKQKGNSLERSYSRTYFRKKRLSSLNNWSASGTENGYLTPIHTENVYEEIN